uniref:Acyl-coenzyme A oxidase n=1 Tax=Zea mays TaxID=4577 RepID=A0A804QZK5_MAIZE
MWRGGSNTRTCKRRFFSSPTRSRHHRPPYMLHSRGSQHLKAMAEVDHLAAERATARFDVEEMKVAWAGSRHAVHVADRMARLVASDPVFRKDNRTMLSRKELFKDTLRKAAHAWKRIVELRLTEEEADLLRQYVDQPGYVDLHWGMFVPAIKGQGTEEQQHKWLPLAYKFQIIGCYAQTELGHGSNVQGLETTATFDPKTDEFVIHSPTLTSSKWWPGGLGKASTHAVVYARLITEGKDYGIHGFIVQLRSLEDHSPLPGVTLGDIGGKFGSGAYNSMDNGVLRFDHVRIPRDQMLMRLSQVTREGKYVHSNVPKQLLYGTMVYVRQSIVADASKALSRAVCIAVRYSAVRKQFGSQDGGPETQVLNYKTQQSRLFPLLASAYAFRFVGDWLNWLYTDVTQKLEAKDFSTLQEAHACTAGLKAVTTSVTADAIEECRKLCGGHGYLNSSGLPELFAVYVPACTYEGDNVVLLLQLASGKQPVGTMAYMGKVQYLMQCKSAVSSAEDWLNPDAIQEAFEARALRMAVNCAQNISQAASQEEAAGFYERSPDLLEAAVAHIQLIIVTKFIEKVHQEIPGHGVKEQLQALCNVYALYILHKHLGDFLATGCITPRQGALANEQLGKLYAQVRPNAVALVDAFNYTDHYLGSVLGRYDGDVYPALYEEAWKDPLNETVVPEGYHEYLRPLIKQQQLKLSRL